MFEGARVQFKVRFRQPFENKLKELGWYWKDNRLSKKFGQVRAEIKEEESLSFATGGHYMLELESEDGISRHHLVSVMNELEEANDASVGKIRLKRDSSPDSGSR
jgi:hypothetical protein